MRYLCLASIAAKSEPSTAPTRVAAGVRARTGTNIGEEIAAAERSLEAATLELAEVEQTLNLAVDLASSCASAYASSDPHIRRQWNQAFFARVEVFDDDDTLTHAPSPPLRDVLD